MMAGHNTQAPGIPARKMKLTRHALSRVLIYLIIIAASICFLIPFAWLISSALKPNDEVFALPQVWIPHPIEWGNFGKALTSLPFGQYALNTLMYGLTVTVGNVLSSAIVAYGFARFRFPGRNVLFIIMLATMMIPGQILLVPQFIMYHMIGWTGTYLPLTVGAFFGAAFYVFLLRQFFMGIPKELSEAALIDGAGEFRIFSQIYLPLSKSALTAVAVFAFQGAWNDFMGPLIYLNSDRLFTLQLGLTEFQGIFTSNWNYIMAASAVVMLPMLLIFFFCQRYFIQGIVTTGTKG